jgi:hypothetical protein
MLSKRLLVASLVTASGVACVATASAQPSLVMTGFPPSALSPNGEIVGGTIYNSATDSASLVRWSRTGGFTNLGSNVESSFIMMSNDGNAMAYHNNNFENINNAANSILYNPAIPNMWERTAITWRWTQANGHLNCGMWSSANRCDFSINTPSDISGNGRYITASGWTNSLCGPFRAQRFDLQTGTWTRLPFSISAPPASLPSRATRGNAISDDGSVIVGYDDNYNSTQSQILRRAAAWVRNPTTDTYTLVILDPDGGEAYGVSGDGNTVIGVDAARRPCRWTRSGLTFTKTLFDAFGIPQFASANGDWVIAADGWIWNAGLNGGVPQALTTYLADNGFTSPGIDIASPTGSPIWGISDNGRTIAVRLVDRRNECLSTFTGGVIYLDTVPCIPPTVVLPIVGDTDVFPAPGFYSFGVAINAFVSGTGPLNYQWQKKNSAGEWYDLFDDAFCTVSYNPQSFDYKAVLTSQLRLGFLNNTFEGEYRCVITGPCGTTTTNEVVVQARGLVCDSIDFNADSLFPDDTDLVDFLSVLAGGPCSNDPLCSDIDFNNDGLFPDDGDLVAFLRVLAGGPCEE